MHAPFSREWNARIASFSLWESSALVCPFFSRELGRSSAPRGTDPAAAEAVKRLSLRRLQMELANEFEREEFFILRSTAADESKLREEDVLSVTSSDPAVSALLAHGGLMKAERIFLGSGKGGVARSRLDERSLSGITSQLP